MRGWGAWSRTEIESRDYVHHGAGGDLDGDGYDDLVVVRTDSSVTLSVFLGGPAGLVWTADVDLGTELPTMPTDDDTAAIGDLDGDGCGDIALAYGGARYYVVYGSCS